MKAVDDGLRDSWNEGDVAQIEGLQSYSACTSFALMKGTAVLVLVPVPVATPLLTAPFPVAASFVAAPIPVAIPLVSVPVPMSFLLVSSVVSYSITRREVGKCGENWIRFEKGELPQDLTDAVERPEGASPSAGSEHETAPGRTKYGDVLE
ncbi:unnamed protein product [Lampetra planeri]